MTPTHGQRRRRTAGGGALLRTNAGSRCGARPRRQRPRAQKALYLAVAVARSQTPRGRPLEQLLIDLALDFFASHRGLHAGHPHSVPRQGHIESLVAIVRLADISYLRKPRSLLRLALCLQYEFLLVLGLPVEILFFRGANARFETDLIQQAERLVQVNFVLREALQVELQAFDR